MICFIVMFFSLFSRVFFMNYFYIQTFFYSSKLNFFSKFVNTILLCKLVYNSIFTITWRIIYQ